jgi:hypothetical protein
MTRLDVGCGDRKEFWEGDGIDLFPYSQKYVFDIETLPEEERNTKPPAWSLIPSNYYDKIKAQHIMEHIKRPESFINILNQIWRVGKPGALFVGESPHWTSSNYFRDPFHVRPISENTYDAFLEGSLIHFGPGYNVQCKFRIVGNGIYINNNRDVCWELSVVK